MWLGMVQDIKEYNYLFLLLLFCCYLIKHECRDSCYLTLNTVVTLLNTRAEAVLLNYNMGLGWIITHPVYFSHTFHSLSLQYPF